MISTTGREGGGSNFGFRSGHDPLFLELATSAERAFGHDPNTTLIKLHQHLRELGPQAAASSCTSTSVAGVKAAKLK